MPQTARTFRIFVNSTFSDLKAERNALQARVFPRLRELGEAHACRFQLIDLRWGVSEEASLDQQAMKICLSEVARCQQISPRPNFIVLLGDRYGWVPPPAQIPDDEFRKILEVTEGHDKALLEQWYILDRNAALPLEQGTQPEWRLKPREKGGPYEQYRAWQPVEARLQRMLAAAAVELGFADDRLLAHTASATEREIVAGALSVEDASRHVACFFRSIVSLPTEFEPAARDFLDVEARRWTVDKAAHGKQEALKRRLAMYLPKENVHTYQARWTGDGITTDHVDRLCNDVYEWFERIILAELERPHEAIWAEERPAHVRWDGALDDMGLAHWRFAEERLHFFVGRTKILGEIAEHVSSHQHRSLAIVGEGGAGKSALLAKAVEQAQAAHPGAQIVYRFLGSTPGSSDGRGLLESLCREISRRYGADESGIPLDYRDLVPELGKQTALASADKPLILFLDSLDQLSASQHARGLTWLPAELPEHVSVILSTRAEEGIAPALQAKQARQVQLGGLEPQDGEELLTQWPASVGRTLQPAQRAEVLRKFEQSQGNPLYPKLAFEEARLWTSYQPPEELAVGLEGIIRENMIGRLKDEGKHGEMLVAPLSPRAPTRLLSRPWSTPDRRRSWSTSGCPTRMT